MAVKHISEVMAAFMRDLEARRAARPDAERLRHYLKERPTREATSEEQEKVEQFIAKYERLRQMCELEPLLHTLLLEAVTCTQGNRARHYERIKQEALPFVGWDACHPELCTSDAYDVWIYALDMLLPMEGEDAA